MAVEITTTAFSEHESPQRIYNTFGKNVRLICPLRDPILRSYSLYKHFKRYGMVRGNIQSACKKMPEIIETSRYDVYLKNWFDVFGKENIHFSFQEHLSLDHDGYIKHICECMGVDYIAVSDEFSGKYNATAKPPSYIVANLFQKSANVLRSMGLYPVINFAKAMGLKKYVFGGANPDADPLTIPEEDYLFLETHLGNELEKLEELLGYEISYWR